MRIARKDVLLARVCRVTNRNTDALDKKVLEGK